MEEQTAVLDACVLYSAPLRDFLMHLTLLDLFHARWTEAIHPDAFFLKLFEWDAERVHQAAERQRKSLKNAPKT